MSVDIGALPNLPDPDMIASDAGLIAASGTRAAESGKSLVSIWNGIQPTYQAPEASLVYEAMQPVAVFTNEAEVVTALVQSALSTFAETVRGMQSRHKDLVAAASICYPESTGADPEYGQNKETEIAGDISALVAEYVAAEEACAEAIRQSDPAQMPGPPGFTDTFGWDLGAETAEEALDRVRRERTRIIIHSSVRVSSLEIGRIFVTYADGTTEAVTRATFRNTVTDIYIARETARLTMNPTPGALVEVPRWARRLGNLFGPFDMGLTIWDNAAQEWNQDLRDHPEYGTWEQLLSAGKNVLFEGGLGTFFSTAGGAIGAVAGAASMGFLAGVVSSVFPVVGTFLGGSIGLAGGAIVGGAAGSTVGGALGEGLGSYLQDVVEGKSHEDALEDAMAEFFDQLW